MKLFSSHLLMCLKLFLMEGFFSSCFLFVCLFVFGFWFFFFFGFFFLFFVCFCFFVFFFCFFFFLGGGGGGCWSIYFFYLFIHLFVDIIKITNYNDIIISHMSIALYQVSLTLTPPCFYIVLKRKPNVTLHTHLMIIVLEALSKLSL